MDLLPVDRIDGSFVPRRAAVASVEVDGETVLAGGRGQPFYRLDPLASLVWSCLDGSGTAEEIALDLAAEFDAPPHLVRDHVVGLTRTLGDLGFLDGVACEGADAAVVQPVTLRPAPSVPRRVVEPPSGWRAELDRLVWAGSSTFRVGEWELGVRSTSAPVHDVLRRALAAHLVDPDDDPASPNFSLHVAEDGGARGPKDFHLLYRGVTVVVRTRDVRRLVDGLFGYLSAAAEERDAETLRLDVLALVHDGAAVLAPASVRSSLASIERRLNAQGLRVVDRPRVRVDVTTGELVVAEPDLVVDRTALDGLPTGGRPDRAVDAGRYPVVGWGFGVGRAEQRPISRALAMTLAGATLVDRAALPPQDALVRLAGVLARVDPVALWADRAEGLVDQLVALLPRPTGRRKAL